jgi:hypothetical protein
MHCPQTCNIAVLQFAKKPDLLKKSIMTDWLCWKQGGVYIYEQCVRQEKLSNQSRCIDTTPLLIMASSINTDAKVEMFKKALLISLMMWMSMIVKSKDNAVAQKKSDMQSASKMVMQQS